LAVADALQVGTHQVVAGLKLVDQMPEAKALFVREALGLTGELPALAKA